MMRNVFPQFQATALEITIRTPPDFCGAGTFRPIPHQSFRGFRVCDFTASHYQIPFVRPSAGAWNGSACVGGPAVCAPCVIWASSIRFSSASAP
jgi:hypothetical protein